MKRKEFLAAAVATGAAIKAMAKLPAIKQNSQWFTDDGNAVFHIPPYLKKGDTIGITCPAGFIKTEDIVPAVKEMESWGFTIKTGDTVGKKDFTLGGTDEERLKDLQQMLDDKSVKAIMCARGGYGSIRIIDKIDFTKFKAHPKWIIGFSDTTLLHSHIIKNFSIASIHSKMCNSFPDNWENAEPIQQESILSIKQALMGEKMNYSVVPNESNKPGIATGILTGGNLKTLETLAGSRSDINTIGRILFVEDTGEYLYSIDRMFWNLKRSGKLNGLKGLVIGGFKVKPSEDPTDEFGKNVQEIVLEKVKEYHFPVCFDFPVGHQKNNFALKCGVIHRLEVKKDVCNLREV